jgi:hypothetical protein
MKRYTKNNYKIKNKLFNKTRKISQLSNVPVNYYSKNFKNTNLIPKTEIISKLFSGYSSFLSQSKLSESVGAYVLDFDQCFIIEPNSIQTGLRRDSVNLSFKMNPQTPLDKLISYSFYLTQSYIFEKNDGISDIKYQIGKDIKRSERTINGKRYSGEYYRNFDENNAATDMFYQNIIDELYKINYKYINLNIANKFALLSCQNVFNFITDLITLKINEILKPENSSVFRPDKFSKIIINNNEISIELNFKSDVIISRDGEPMDPEYPCGQLEFNLYIDLLNNKYELKNFILSYDIDKCGPEKQINETEQSLSEDQGTKSKFKPEYIIPASLVTAGIVATPILLATLGGKKRKYNKRTKKRRRYR